MSMKDMKTQDTEERMNSADATHDFGVVLGRKERSWKLQEEQTLAHFVQVEPNKWNPTVEPNSRTQQVESKSLISNSDQRKFSSLF